MELKDVIHYYIGCRCFNTWFPEGHEEYDRNWKLEGYRADSIKPYCLGTFSHDTWTDSIKPILRRVNDITEEENDELQPLVGVSEVNGCIIKHDTAATFNWGIKKGFDLFGLIDAGLAVDAKLIK